MSCGLAPMSRVDEGGKRLAAPTTHDSLALSKPWALLLRLLDMDRTIQPDGWPFPRGEDWFQWRQANEGLRRPDWPAWKEFAAESAAPYLLAEDHGRPVMWLRANDDEWYGVMFHFGMQPGRMNWWVAGQPLRYETAPDGGTLIITHEVHEPAATVHTLNGLEKAVPPGLFAVNAEHFLTLREALDSELQRHPAEERDRCRFYVYPAMSPGHGGLTEEDTPFALQTVENTRNWICKHAWIWLSPLVGLWDPVVWRADMAIEIAGDPNIDKPETAAKLAKLKPRRKYAMTCAGCGGRPGSGDPFKWLLERVHPEVDVVPAGAPRIVQSLLDQARDEFWATADDERTSQARRQAAQAAKRRLRDSSVRRDVFITSDIFAAAALQLEWAVDAELTLLSCPHPRCGRAFFREAGYAGRFCPDHRSAAARQQRSRMWKNRSAPRFGGEAIDSPPG